MRISLLGAESFHRLARDMHKVGSRLTQDTQRALRKPAFDARDTIRRKILEADMRGRRTRSADRFIAHIPSRGVKRPTARAVQAEVKIANGDPRAEIVLRADQVPARIRDLIPYWAGERVRLRHPIMGNRSTWVGQRIPNVWNLPNEQDFIDAVDGVLDGAVRTIERG